MNIYFKNSLDAIKELEDNSVQLILTDPPYNISKTSGMNTHFNTVRKGDCLKTLKEWSEFKGNKDYTDKERDNYLAYGSIYGKKYATLTDFGEWDRNFTLQELESFIKLFYVKLCKGGTCIIWYDRWKLESLKELLSKYNFKQIRMIEWVKTNPQPINSQINYLSNAKEYALVGVKEHKKVFNSEYDNGIYYFPMACGKYKIHPTQKNLQLIECLVEKHSNPADKVVDVFLGGGTTAFACKRLNREFFGGDINPDYKPHILSFLDQIKPVNPKTSKIELFKELSNYNPETGVSRIVHIDEFTGKYSCLQIGNGGSWCRKSCMSKYRMITIKGNKNINYLWQVTVDEKQQIREEVCVSELMFSPNQSTKIQYLKLCGNQNVTIQRPIKKSIRKIISKLPCCVCGNISNTVCDHKNDLYNDIRVLSTNTQTLHDFQPLCNSCNLQKRGVALKTLKTLKRYKATNIPQLKAFGVDFIEGDERLDFNDPNALVGSYWYDPVAFMTFVSSVHAMKQ